MNYTSSSPEDRQFKSSKPTSLFSQQRQQSSVTSSVPVAASPESDDIAPLGKEYDVDEYWLENRIAERDLTGDVGSANTTTSDDVILASSGVSAPHESTNKQPVPAKVKITSCLKKPSVQKTVVPQEEKEKPRRYTIESQVGG